MIEREVREGTVLKIGRFTDRFLSNNRITFRSKVVSRGHAEIWTEAGKVCCTYMKGGEGVSRMEALQRRIAREKGERDYGTFSSRSFFFF